MQRAFKLGTVLLGLVVTQITGCGSDDSSGSGSSSLTCTPGIAQTLPPAPTCDATARTCFGVAVPADTDACNQCVQAAKDMKMDGYDLTECSCNHCAPALAGCFQSAQREGANGNAQRDQACAAIVKCALDTGCKGSECYCGAGVSVGACLAAGAVPSGPCVQVIAQAGGCTGTQDQINACVAAAQLDTNTAVGRANLVGQCTTGDPAFSISGQCVTAAAM